MRMRKKKHSAERIEACAEFLLKNPIECFGHESEIFPSATKMLLEIGCGKGDFASALSQKNPECGIIALEKIPDVAMFALEKAKASIDQREDNLRFIIGNADNLNDWFSPSTFSRIYVNFCDPWPKKGYFKRRLTSPLYLERYRTLLVDGGELHFKTDNEALFEWSVEQFIDFGLEVKFITRDLHNSELARQNIVTEYERHFSSMGMNIYSAHVVFHKSESDVGETNDE